MAKSENLLLCSTPRRGPSTKGLIVATGPLFALINRGNVFPVLWRMISTVKGYQQYCEGIPSVLLRDTIVMLGDTISTARGTISTVEGYHQYVGVSQSV